MPNPFSLNSKLLTMITFALAISTFMPKSAKADTIATLSDGTSVSLLGIGMHQELRNDIYVGALYAPAGITDADQLKDDSVAKRMSIRLVANYSHRKMSRHWKERLAMNNPRTSWQPLTKQIVQFSRIFKRNLEMSDELNIDYIPGKGTEIYLNGTLFQTIDDSGFTELLLNVWLGTTPPTKAFKSSIRGQSSDSAQAELLTTYQALQPVSGRFDADLAPVTKVAVKTNNAPAKKPSANKPPAKKAEVKPEPKKQTVKKNTSDNVASKPAEKKETVTKKPEPKASDLIAKPKFDIKVDTGLVSTPVTNKQPQKKPEVKNEEPAQNEVKAEKVAKLEEPEVSDEDFFDADLLSGSYTRDLLDEIKKYQEYPKKALVQGDQGDVVAKVTIDADGEIEDIELIERSGSRILDKAVVKMIKKAAPFQAIPKELNLTQFDFEAPFSFQL